MKKEKVIVTVLGYEVVEGSKRHQRLLEDKKHYDDLSKYENN